MNDKLMELYNQLILLAKQLEGYQMLCQKKAKLYEELADNKADKLVN